MRRVALVILAMFFAVSCRTTDSELSGEWRKPKPPQNQDQVVATHAYYGNVALTLVRGAMNNPSPTTEDYQKLRKALWMALNYAHIVEKDQADRLVKSCPKKESTENSATTCKENVRFSYSDARSYMFGDERFFLGKDGSGDYFVTDVYCGRKYFKDKVVSADGRNIQRADQPFNIGPRQIPVRHEIINCEHTWPKSRFRYFEQKYTNTNTSGYLWKVADLHHLLPTDSKANGLRGNYYYGEVAGSDEVANCPQNKFGAPKVPGDLNLPNGFKIPSPVYEPPPAIRGDIARGLFYFAVRYDLVIHPFELYYLRKWHREDPVSPAEQTKHEGVFALQNNRNPFIDFPFLVDKVDLITCVDCTNPNAPTPPYESGGQTNQGSNNSGNSTTPPTQNNPAPEQVGGFVANPCAGQSGKPYKKYVGFALGKTAVEGQYVILKFSDANGVPVVEASPTYSSVAQFMEAKGILAQCGGM